VQLRIANSRVIEEQVRARRLCRVRLRGLDITRRFHVIHNEARRLTARGRAFVAALQAEAPLRSGRVGRNVHRRSRTLSTKASAGCRETRRIVARLISIPRTAPRRLSLMSGWHPSLAPP
jgi:hypothetical protein